MNIRLEYPLSKSDVCLGLSVNSDEIDIEFLSEKLKIDHQSYLELTQEYDNFHREYKSCQDDIQKFKQSLNCFEETFAIFDAQLKLNEENQKEAMEHEKEGLKKHYDNILEKLESIKDCRKQLEKECNEKNSQSIILDRKINELKPQLNEKKRQLEQIKAILINKIGNEDIEKMLDYSNNSLPPSKVSPMMMKADSFNSYDNYDHAHSQKLNYCLIDKEYLANACSPINSPISETNSLNNSINSFSNSNKSSNNYSAPSIKRNEQSDFDSIDQNEKSAYLNLDTQNLDVEKSPSIDAEWYLGDLSKENVNLIMKNQPDGTFLVRDSKNRAEAPFTLTVRVNGSTKMLRILQSSDSQHCGFKPDKLEFKSLVHLIENYLHQPLITTNPDLTIHLVYPMTKELVRKYLN